MWQKGHISGVPVGHFSPQTVVYKLARQTISSMVNAGKNENVNKAIWSKERIIATQYVTSPSSQCHICVYNPCALPCDHAVTNAVAQNYHISYKLQ